MRSHIDQIALRLVIVLAICYVSQAFYVPGVAPQDFAKGDVVEVKVNNNKKAHILYLVSYYKYDLQITTGGQDDKQQDPAAIRVL